MVQIFETAEILRKSRRIFTQQIPYLLCEILYLLGSKVQTYCDVYFALQKLFRREISAQRVENVENRLQTQLESHEHLDKFFPGKWKISIIEALKFNKDPLKLLSSFHFYPLEISQTCLINFLHGKFVQSRPLDTVQISPTS